MKVAIITDTHYGARKGSKYLHDYFELFYQNVFFPALKEHGVEAVIHMGDAFDSRKSIDYQSLEWSKSCLLYTSPSPRDATLSRMPSSA